MICPGVDPYCTDAIILKVVLQIFPATKEIQAISLAYIWLSKITNDVRVLQKLVSQHFIKIYFISIILQLQYIFVLQIPSMTSYAIGLYMTPICSLVAHWHHPNTLI